MAWRSGLDAKCDYCDATWLAFTGRPLEGPILELSVNMTFNEIRHRARLVKDYGETPLVEADDARLGQVFINLIVNAAQAIPDGDS